MHSPRVSVIMPTYNAEKYINEAIDSILNQTFKDFEFLIIDDNSTDGTREIINSYNDSRIRLINGPCKGISMALNKGIENAKGEYIARMDADDISLPNRLEVQIEFLEKNEDVGVLGAKATLFGKHSIAKYFNEGFYQGKPETFKAGILDVINTCPFCHPTVMFRKSVLEKYNIRYNESYKASEDQELWSRLVLLTKFANINRPLLEYRLHSDNATSIMAEGEILAMQARCKLIQKLLPSKDLNDILKLKYSEFENQTYRINRALASLGFEYIENFEKDKKESIFKIFLSNIFSIKNEYRDNIKRKFLTLFWIKIRIKKEIL